MGVVLMETTLLIRCCQYFPRTTTHQSQLTKFNNTRIRTHVGSPMRDPTPTLRFVSSNIINTNSQRLGDPRRFLFFDGFVPSKSMAPKLEETAVKEGGDKKKQEEELTKNLPPPPEKPEPGDCCGSGCVRCVWDVYYEELEAYNKLYKSDSMNSTSKSS